MKLALPPPPNFEMLFKPLSFLRPIDAQDGTADNIVLFPDLALLE